MAAPAAGATPVSISVSKSASSCRGGADRVLWAAAAAREEGGENAGGPAAEEEKEDVAAAAAEFPSNHRTASRKAGGGSYRETESTATPWTVTLSVRAASAALLLL